ncbi:S8 family serine peptidase [Micromonospora deserti]|uniref:Peptidase S8/S53 domain-containing protein n=1 Tax=Micromonospora deserti TaxID=2070366 RepID=A0A2W2E9D8_9ACTN|nr:S8 family serine peptidase [Micromonospora deserti]PZG01514.1 hypothetical protein C1I99_06810 [Micromonospora deserti]
MTGPGSARRARSGRWRAAAAGATLLALVTSLFAVAPPATAAGGVFLPATDGIKGEYVVMLSIKDSGMVDEFAKNVAEKYQGTLQHVYRNLLPGFAIELSAEAAKELSGFPEVAYVEQNALLYPQDVQTDPPYNLDAIDQRAGLNDEYHFDTTGATVHAYVLDSGMRHTHEDFEGRATGDVSFVPHGIDRWGTGDCSGHGTKMAGTIGGRLHGVAKKVRLHTVRIAGCYPGTVAQGIAGLDWIAANAIRPAVVNISSATPGNRSLDEAVTRLIGRGITVVAAAGNHADDACLFSPARIPDVITVSSVHLLLERMDYANYGPCVDLFAMADRIPTTTADSDTSTGLGGGTSIAAPHVTGLVARYLERFPTATPQLVAARLADEARRDRIVDTRGATNLMVYADPGGPGNDGFGGRGADVNGDGRDDIISFGRGAGADVHVALSTGGGFGPATRWHEYFAAGNEIPLLGDVDGDRRADLITFTRGGSADVYVARSTSTSFGPSERWHTAFAGGTQTPLVGDFNGDGRDDIATLTREGSRDVYVALSDGSSFVGTGVRWHDDFAGDDQVPLVGDVNGDGRDDIVGFRRFGFSDVTVALSTGSGFVAGPQRWLDYFLDPAVESTLVPVVGDFNGDGRDDVAAVNRATYGVAVGISDGRRFLPPTRWGWTFAGGITLPGAGDFDGDRRDDMVGFARGTSGEVLVGRSTGGSFSNAVRWGGGFAPASEVPMPAVLW